MDARVTAVAGPLAGKNFTLGPAESCFGREAAAEISIPDGSVSRRHCVLLRDSGGAWLLRDLGSHNGTYLNGAPIAEHAVVHGDEISIGRSRFIFLLADVPEPSGVRLRHGDEDTRTIVRLDLRESFYLRQKPPDSAAQDVINGFQSLLKIAAASRASMAPADLAAEILRQAGPAISADAGAVMVFDADGQAEPCAVWGAGDVTPVLEVPEAMAERMLSDRKAVLSQDQPGAGAPVSVVAAPLAAGDRVLGLVYFTSAHGTFRDSHLQFTAAAGAIVGPIFEDARGFESLRIENRRLQAESNIEHGMIGESAAAREIYQFIARAGPTPATVLLLGESGTGKELVARAIHRNSPRSARPFVAINCASLTENLLESELFGHERGAFTGAVAQKRGKLELADGGTVFLDEVGELPLTIQAKLLRALQEREFERLGGTRPIRVDIRLIAATNRDLKAAIAEGRFREDLYYRLNVVSFRLPPLRERIEDVPLLAAHFLTLARSACGAQVEGISPQALACLREYSWPGNIRELQNAIERAVVLGATTVILPEDLPEAVLESASTESIPSDSYEQNVRREKRDLILRTLEQTDGNYTEAARLLQLHPNSLHRIIRNLGIKDEIERRLKG